VTLPLARPQQDALHLLGEHTTHPLIQGRQPLGREAK
jgi:hypothetical protein